LQDKGSAKKKRFVKNFMPQESFCNIATQNKKALYAHVAELVDASRLKSGHSQGCEGATSS
jgi:hypothetical protein